MSCAKSCVGLVWRSCVWSCEESCVESCVGLVWSLVRSLVWLLGGVLCVALVRVSCRCLARAWFLCGVMGGVMCIGLMRVPFCVLCEQNSYAYNDDATCTG